MLVPGELGFYFVIFIVFIVFPVFSLVIRRKWRLELARRDEISRLLVLAAEEAERAEFEASFSYCVAPRTVSSPVVVVCQSVCAVCCSPTHNRCSRCKAVYYCSGKCQIIHWRQGHKDVCRPSPVGYGIDDEASGFVTLNVNDGTSSDEQRKAPLEGRKGENAAVGSPLRGEEPGSIAVLHDSSVSFRASTLVPGHVTCVDTSTSTSDDDSLHGLDSESLDSSTSFDSFETASSDSHFEQIKPFEKKTRVRVDFDASNYDSGGPKGEAFSEKTSSLGSRVNHSNEKSVDPSISASGFWDVTLDSSRTRKHVPSNKPNPKPIGAGYGKLPDLKSTKQYSADPSGGLSSSKHLHVSEKLGNNFGTARAAETTSSNKQSAAHIIRQSSTRPSFKEPGTRIKGAGENHVKSAEDGVSAATSREIISPSSSSRANRLDRSDQDTQQSSQTAAFSVQSNAFSSSGMKGNTPSVAKSVKAVQNNGIPLRVANPTPTASVGLKSSMQKVYDQFRVPKSSKQGDGVGKNSEKAVFAYELFVKLYHWNKVELRPCGLINCGNSCYANAVLQCLAFTPPITAYLLQGLHSKTCTTREWCFTCEFERLILKANEVGYPQSPIGILSQIQKIGNLTHGREEDAHEFLRYAIETMQSICLREAGLKGCSSLEEETTLVGLTFGGYLRSKIKCTKCHGKSEKVDSTMDLTVEIEGDIETLEEALQRFTGTECLDGENKYHCGRCNSYEKAKKKLSILEAPNVLTVALKRFQSGKFGKLNKSIRFPEILNLAPYMRGGSDKAPVYRLYGVVVHLDIMNASFSGHYVCYVRNAQNKWFKIDDSMVQPVELDQVLNKGAYMLFYSRCSPRAPRSIRSTIVSRDLPIKIRNPPSDLSRSNVKTSASRTRDLSTHANRIPDNLTHKDETSRNFNMYGFESSSDNSSLFSYSDEISSSTDSSARDSISADDISQYIFGYNAFSLSSDLDTSSSSSSSSSSPLYMAHSPLSNSERYSSSRSEQNVPLTDNGFLHSNISKQDRNLVNISIREVDAKTLGSANPLDNGKSGVYLRRSTRKKAD